jgi:EF-P beta-lysylation protein EpmB
MMYPCPLHPESRILGFEMAIVSAVIPVVRPRLTASRYASWQEAMKDAVRDPAELCRLLGLPEGTAASAAPEKGVRTIFSTDHFVAKKRKENSSDPFFDFPLFVPRGYVARMQPGDPHDPLLRQVLPIDEELAEVPGFVDDPVEDEAAARRPGLLQKYAGRVLLVTTGVCAVHCRYCFRRHFPYADALRRLTDWQPALDEIAADRSIREVILSGGDPFTIGDRTLGELVSQLAAIRHLRRLRVHTRLPIVIPERVTDELVALLRGTQLTPIVVVHANHANELDEQVAAALAKLADGGIVLLNQAVLLRGVNDSVEAQAALCERLVDVRVMPYYLHQLDRVAGAAHFEVPVATGRRIVEELRKRLPGYAVPRYVAEVAGAGSKVLLE